MRLFKDTAIVVVISTALIICGEFSLRTFYPQGLLGTSIQGRRFSMRDPAIGMRYVPGAHWRFKHPEYTVEYAINADGFRDTKEHPIPKPNGTRRVLLLGDSFTFGYGSNYEDIWPVIVERFLEESGHDSIDLVKAGIEGKDTRSELILMRELVDKYDPDVIVVGFLINDLYSNRLYGIEEKQVTQEQIIENGVEGSPGRFWLRTMEHTFVRNKWQGGFHLLNLFRRILLANDRLYCKLYLISARGEFMTGPWTSEVAQKVKITEILLEKMQAYALSKGKKLIVFSIPQQFQVLYLTEFKTTGQVDVAIFDHHFSNVAKEKGFVWVRSLESFAATEEPGKLFYRWDGHLTPAGNRIAAEVFMREIAPRLN